MISRSKKKKDQKPKKIGTIADLIDPDLLKILEDKSNDSSTKIKVIIKKR